MKNDRIYVKNSADVPLIKFPGIGPRRFADFQAAGMGGAFALLRHLPRAYQERGNIRLLAEVQPGSVGAFMLTVASEPSTAMIKGRMKLTKVRLFDDSGSCTAIFFNQPYLHDVLTKGAVFRVWGKLTCGRRGLELISPVLEPAIRPATLMPLVPVYKLSGSLTQKMLRDAVKYALDGGYIPPDVIPEDIRRARGLIGASDAYRMIHRPATFAELNLAQKYFQYEELYLFALGLRMSRVERRVGEGYAMPDTDTSGIAEMYPFEFTGDQKKSIAEIAADMKGDGKTVKPMARLVCGDVGSGKTAVAAAAAYIAVKNGYQCALMAPTGILASQHFAELEPMFRHLGYRCELLTGSVSPAEKKRIKAGLAEGSIHFIIGTHALITPDVEFKQVGLVITDEQHRFGVAQRGRLGGEASIEDGPRPHVLVMSATPIPRTLALILYGDLDISAIAEMPPGRTPVDTFAVGESYRSRLDAFILKNVEMGGQVYIVCPTVEAKEEDAESEFEEKDGADTLPPLKNATDYAESLKERMPSLRVALVHGRMKSREKDDIMSRFAAGEFDVLVSTTVIEVGVNVPRATLMIVENAERFGLSQLHQLRGRVGRGAKQSYCVLVSDAKGVNARDRLNIMKNESSGYKISEFDLKQRGPGDFVAISGGSTRQHGMARSDVMFGGEWAEETLCGVIEDVSRVLEGDPGLETFENLPARERIEAMFAISSNHLS